MADQVAIYVGTTKFTLKGKWVKDYTFDYTDPDTNETTTVEGYDEHDITETDLGVHCSKVDGNTTNPDTDKTNWETWVDLTAMVAAKAAEEIRKQSEQERIANETARQKKFTELAEASASATSSANDAATAASSAATSAKDTIAEMQALAKQIAANEVGKPNEMILEYEEEFSNRNPEQQKINATLKPSYYPQNVLFEVVEGTSLTVDPNGKLKIVGTGTTIFHVIPTNNTSLWKEISITVTEPSLVFADTDTLLLADDVLLIV